MDETELALLIQQHFREKSWSEAQHSIECLSGCCLSVEYLGTLVRQGDWENAIRYFHRFVVSSNLELTSTSNKILFELHKHKFFDCLNRKLSTHASDVLKAMEPLWSRAGKPLDQFSRQFSPLLHAESNWRAQLSWEDTPEFRELVFQEIYRALLLDEQFQPVLEDPNRFPAGYLMTLASEGKRVLSGSSTLQDDTNRNNTDSKSTVTDQYSKEPVMVELPREEERSFDQAKVVSALPKHHILSIRWQYSKISAIAFCPALPNLLLVICSNPGGTFFSLWDVDYGKELVKKNLEDKWAELVPTHISWEDAGDYFAVRCAGTEHFQLFNLTSNAAPQLRLAKNCKSFINHSATPIIDIYCEKIYINNQMRCFVLTIDETGLIKVWDMLAVEQSHKLLYKIPILPHSLNPPSIKQAIVSMIRIQGHIIIFAVNKSTAPSLSLHIINDSLYKPTSEPITIGEPQLKLILPLKRCYDFYLDTENHFLIRKAYAVGVKDHHFENGVKHDTSTGNGSEEIVFMEVNSLNKNLEGSEYVAKQSRTYKDFNASSILPELRHRLISFLTTPDGAPVLFVNEGEKIKFWLPYQEELLSEIQPTFADFTSISSSAPALSSHKPTIKVLSSSYEHNDEDTTAATETDTSIYETLHTSSRSRSRGDKASKKGEEREPLASYLTCVIGDDFSDEVTVYSSQAPKQPKISFIEEADKKKRSLTASPQPTPATNKGSSSSGKKRRRTDEKSDTVATTKESKKPRRTESSGSTIVSPPADSSTTTLVIEPPQPPIVYENIDSKLSFKKLPNFGTVSPITKLCYSHKGDMILSMSTAGENQVWVWPVNPDAPPEQRIITLNNQPLEFPQKEMAIIKCEQKFFLHSAYVPQVMVLAKNDQYIVLTSGGPLTLWTNKSPAQQQRKVMAPLSAVSVEDKCVAAFDFDRTDNNLFVYGCMNGEVTIRKNANPKGVYSFMAHSKPIFEVKLLKKKALVTADGDGMVKIWHWNSSVPPPSNGTKFTCEVKYEIPGIGESDNVSILVTPSNKPQATATPTSTDAAPLEAPQEASNFIVKRSTSLQIWDSEGVPGPMWFPEGKPIEVDKKKGIVNEDALSIKDAKYSANGEFVFVLLSDESIRVLTDALQPVFSTSSIPKLINQAEHKTDSKGLQIDEPDAMSIDFPPVTCIATNPQFSYQVAFGGSDGSVHIMEIASLEQC